MRGLPYTLILTAASWVTSCGCPSSSARLAMTNHVAMLEMKVIYHRLVEQETHLRCDFI